MQVNQTSLTSFDSNHELYDLVRPDFKPFVVDASIKGASLGKGAKVIELGAGTGKFTREIADKGFQLTAVEPSSGMRASFTKNFPDIPILDGSSYHMPFPDDYNADAVIIAQAYHWFSDHRSLEEISRVLKPGGYMILVWNFDHVSQLAKDQWQKQITELVWSYDNGVPQYRRLTWIKSFDDQDYFEMPYKEEYFYFDRLFPNDAESVWQYWLSRSYITALPDEEKAQLKAKIYEMYEKDKKKEMKGDKAVAKFGTHVVWVRKSEK